MRERSSESSVRFRGAFTLKGVDRPLPPGAYRILTEEAALDGISFIAHRRVSTSIVIPIGEGSQEIAPIDPGDLDDALLQDRLAFPQ
jgi:hypothetical protein